MFVIKQDAARNALAECLIFDEHIPHTAPLSALTVGCKGEIFNTVMTGCRFDALRVAVDASLLFQRVALEQTVWTGADTARMSFRQCDFTGSGITARQLARAQEVDVNCVLPKGVTLVGIELERRESGQARPTLVQRVKGFAARLGLT